MEGIQTLKVSWPWPSIRPYRRASLIDLYLYTKLYSYWRNFLWRDGRTDGRTDIFPLYTIRSTFGSPPNNNILAYLGSTLVGSKHQKGSSAVFAKSSILRVHTIINWLPWCMREMKPEDSIQFHNLFSHVSYLSRSLEMLLSPERLARIRDAGS